MALVPSHVGALVMPELLVGAVSSLVASVVWVASIWGYKRIMDRRPFARLFNFHRRRPILFVFPCRSDEPGAEGLIQNARISFEDMLASNYIQRCIELAGFSPEVVEMREDRYLTPGSRDFQANLVVLCSPKSNTVTAPLLDEINRTYDIDWGFKRLPSGRFAIVTGAGVCESKTYDQAAAIKAAGQPIEQGQLDDVAMIIKCPNPFDRGSTVLIVAGVRGIGTWGAAYYLRDHATKLSERTGGEPFCLLLRIRYAALQITHFEEVTPPMLLNARRRLTPARPAALTG
ncbi:MAG: hypothetical protein ACKVZ0_18115 [Gemmatimonadales bacterium]